MDNLDGLKAHQAMMEKASTLHQVTLRCNQDMWFFIKRHSFGKGDSFPYSQVKTCGANNYSIQLSGIKVVRVLDSLYRVKGESQTSERQVAAGAYAAVSSFVQDSDSSSGGTPVLCISEPA